MQLVSRLGQRLRIWFARMDPYLVRGVARYYRKGMQLFWWYGVFLSLSSAFVDSYITLFILSLGGSRLQVGSLSSLASLFGLLLPLPGAQWAARWGKRKPVVVISFGLRYVALLAALSAPLFAAGPALVGVVIGCFALRAAFLHLGNSPWTSFVGELMPPARRGRYFSSRKMAMAIATLIFVPAAGQFRPDFVLVSAGFDAHRDDPLGGMGVTTEGFAEMTRIVKRIAEEHCQGRLVSVLEGGYDLDGLAASVAAHLRILME